MEAGTPDLIKLEDLDAAAGALTGRKHLLSILVENRPGVLARIAGLFSRRGFNIDTLAVGPTEDPEISRITLTVDGAVHPIDQVDQAAPQAGQRDQDQGHGAGARPSPGRWPCSRSRRRSRAAPRSCSSLTSSAPRSSTVSRRSLTIEVTGSAEKIEAFERMIRPHGLIEMVRTGEIAIARAKPES